ncbi:lipid A biosynthesis acyltransferase [uncultured Arcticibacterium sp.]|uniref:LpxL/LpxP family acyltransferase n=1 Tax=uncultured Arcticibacterium sp. TaxID=2173042 RepID=UPI0030F87407
MSQWKGKTNANLFGIKIFVFVLNNVGLGFAYFILRFVALYYFLFAWKSNKSSYFYFHKVLKFGKLKSLSSMYQNYYVFGQTLLDKVALLSGVKTNFTIDHDGIENLDAIVAGGKGGILISAHVGNWEIAGQLLNRLDTKFNVLMYENEHANIKNYLDGVQKNKNINIIPIKDGEMGHIIALNNAFKNNELLVLHGDRFREGAPTLNTPFMGLDAYFPEGPFYLAAKFGVPVTYAFSMKETDSHYHFYASKPIEVKRERKPDAILHTLLGEYVVELEKMVKKYPTQWFNYYPFWKQQ